MELRPTTEHKRGRGAIAFLALILAGGTTLAAEGCAAVKADTISSVAGSYTHRAASNAATTKAIERAFSSASNIEMHNVSQDDGSSGLSYMTWNLPNGDQCRIDTTTPVDANTTAQDFAKGESPNLSDCKMPAPAPSHE